MRGERGGIPLVYVGWESVSRPAFIMKDFELEFVRVQFSSFLPCQDMMNGEVVCAIHER